MSKSTIMKSFHNEEEAKSYGSEYLEFFQKVVEDIIRLENATFQFMFVLERSDGYREFMIRYSLEEYNGAKEKAKYLADKYCSHWLEFAQIELRGSIEKDVWNISKFSLDAD